MVQEVPRVEEEQAVLNRYSISVNGLGASPHTALGKGDVVALVPKVEGGIR
ncbi:MAG: hypothetical protein ABIK09_06845 [Pseudomonadota bacterium]